MTHKNNHCPALQFPVLLLLLYSTTLYGANRQIEEVVVTAEKREATVSDTSISITAFNTEMIEDLGIQGADELVNYIPATTRDAYDIRIRGVGRNFRALGGDPGVATYYNGVYSPDFGIAASENALYDLARVEVLRGPQGTLYGRNSIGGALNYVTKRPTFDLDAQLRTQLGNFNSREFYGFVSGPLIDDVLAARLVGVKRDRDPTMSNAAGDDVDSIDDRNASLALLWQPSETITVNVRGNDRESDRDFGNRVFITEGAAPLRGTLASDQFVHGLRLVDASDPQAIAFTNPVTGAVVYGAPRRPGVDATTWPFQPNATYGRPGLANLMSLDKEDPINRVAVNHDSGCDSFPYTTCNSDHEYFGHRSAQTEVVWDIGPRVSLTYIFGYTDFNYTFNQDLDDSDADFSAYRQTVEEDVYNYSHELQLNWGVGDNFTATSGIYFFDEVRDQDYSLSNTTVRYTQAADYGALDTPVGFLGGSINDLLFASSLEPGGGHTYLWSDEVGTSDYGRWDGDPRGDAYHHVNKVRNEATAFYTQGSYRFNQHWQLVLGVRYAKDDKAAREVRGGYSEISIPWADSFIGFIPGVGFQFPGVGGQTTLSVTNIALGAATPSGDPSDPITPTCALTATECATPLRLGGVPISYSSHVAGEDDWSDTNYRVNLDWTPNDDILMYFSVTTGYRAGGYQLGVTDARDQQRDENGLPVAGAGIIPLTYDKEEVQSVEVGYKGMHLDNTLQLNMSVYQYDYDNYQDRLNVFDPVRQQGVDIVQNANGVVNRGFEVEAMWLATDVLTVGGNYSFTDTEYKDDYFVVINDDPALPQSLFGNPTSNPELFVFNAKGDPLKRIPEHKATLWGSYVVNTNFGSLTFRGTYSYTGEFYDEAFQTPRELVPDRFRTDVSVTWNDLSQRWTVRAFVDNVTGERNLRGIGTASESANWRMTGTLLAPRFYGLDVTYDLGGS